MGLGRQNGFTIVEMLIGAIIAFSGITAGLATLAGAQRTQRVADQTEVLAQQSRSYAEQLATLDYERLAMKQNVESANLAQMPAADAARFTLTNTTATYTTKPSRDAAVVEQITAPANGDEAGDVEFGPSLENVGSSKALVWRLISWRNEDCSAATSAIACAGDKNTKRVTIGLRTANLDGSGKGQIFWSSVVAIDPDAASAPSACGVNQCGAASDDKMQSLFLYDTPCNATSRAANQEQTPAGSGGHPTHNTSARHATQANQSSYCWNSTNRTNGPYMPDLMGPEPPGNVADPLIRYSRDQFETGPAANPAKYGYGAGGRVFRRIEGCQSSYAQATATSGASRFSIHSWSSNKMPNNGMTISGLTVLDLFGGTYMAAPQSYGTLCITVGARKEGPTGQFPANGEEQTLFKFYCQVNPWPRGRDNEATLPDGMTGMPVTGRRACRFNPQAGELNGGTVRWPATGGYPLPKDWRLTLSISVCGSACGNKEYSRNDLALFYDHPNYQSKISFATPEPAWD